MVLPCYNPQENWEQVVVDAMASLKKKTKVEMDLILVNDGSTRSVDKAAVDFIRQAIPSLHFIEYDENRGKGFALRKGVAVAETDLIIYTDIDFPYTDDSFCEVLKKLEDGFDVVPGHRGDAYYDKTPFFRKLISKILRWTLKTFLRLPTDDSQCGIKGFNQTGAAVFLDTEIDRFLFDLEFLKLSAKRKLKIEKASVTLKPDIVFSKVNLKILARESWNFIKILFR